MSGSLHRRHVWQLPEHHHDLISGITIAMSRCLGHGDQTVSGQPAATYEKQEPLAFIVNAIAETRSKARNLGHINCAVHSHVYHE